MRKYRRECRGVYYRWSSLTFRGPLKVSELHPLEKWARKKAKLTRKKRGYLS